MEHSNLIDLLKSKYNVVRETRDYLLFLCPFHNENTASFFVNTSNNYFKYFLINNLGIISLSIGTNFLKDFSKLLSELDINQEILYKVGILIKKPTNGYRLAFNNHIIFPFYNFNGEIVGFGGKNLSIKNY